MKGFDQLVVAIGTADADRSLIAYAALVARLGASKDVRFVHVAEEGADAAAIRQEMRGVVAEHFHAPDTPTTCDVLRGPLTDRLLAYVTEFQADLVLIGAKKHKLGARLAMVSPCSVAVVPADAKPSIEHLLVAFDFSDAAAGTLQWATGLIAGGGVRCTALHVVTHESTDLFGSPGAEADQKGEMRQILASANRHGVAVEARLADVARTAEVGRSHPFSFPASIQGIDVAQTILAEAQAVGADCIAMSTRGRSRSASILLGSVTEKVIERSPVPLFVGKQTARRLGLAAILLGHAGEHAGLKTN